MRVHEPPLATCLTSSRLPTSSSLGRPWSVPITPVAYRRLCDAVAPCGSRNAQLLCVSQDRRSLLVRVLASRPLAFVCHFSSVRSRVPTLGPSGVSGLDLRGRCSATAANLTEHRSDRSCAVELRQKRSPVHRSTRRHRSAPAAPQITSGSGRSRAFGPKLTYFPLSLGLLGVPRNGPATRASGWICAQTRPPFLAHR